MSWSGGASFEEYVRRCERLQQQCAAELQAAEQRSTEEQRLQREAEKRRAEELLQESERALNEEREARRRVETEKVALELRNAQWRAAYERARREHAALTQEIETLKADYTGRAKRGDRERDELRAELTALRAAQEALDWQRRDDANVISQLKRENERLTNLAERLQRQQKTHDDYQQWRQQNRERAEAAAREQAEEQARRKAEAEARRREEEEARKKRDDARKTRDEAAAFARMSGRWDAREDQRTQHRRRERPPSATPHLTALQRYEMLWGRLLGPITATSTRFSVDTFPWPSHSPEEMNTAAVERFLLTDVEAGRRKYTVRQQLKRWHPDKFSARGVLQHTVEEDWDLVMQRQKEVVISLTDLLQRL